MAPPSSITLFVPSPLRRYCGGADELELQAATVSGALEELERKYPDLFLCVCDETGAVRRHINVFVNESHMRDLAGLETALAPGDRVIVLPAVSGG